jgi:hypothetical protein
MMVGEIAQWHMKQVRRDVRRPSVELGSTILEGRAKNNLTGLSWKYVSIEA